MKVFIVGGAVRDGLLGLVPKDIDYVVVGSTVDEMIAQGFSKVGADFPVFLHPETGDEYALARTERKVGAGYHGFAVDADPSTTLADDLSRRDLTINAMAQDVVGQIHDPFNGRQDLKDKILRHVSPAFAEDPLRVVRLARFAARFPDFTIAPETLALAQEVVESGELNDLPHERFWAEMTKVMGEEDPCKFFWAVCFTEMDRYVDFFHELYGDMHVKNIAHMCRMMQGVKHTFNTPEGRLAAHTALTARQDSETIRSAPVSTQSLFDNINRVRAMKEVTADSVFDVINHAKGFSQSQDFSTLLFTMKAATDVAEQFPIDYATLGEAWIQAKMVTAEQFMPTFSGKSLGEAIKQGRKAAIEKVINEAA